jgi:hypothetical protein
MVMLLFVSHKRITLNAIAVYWTASGITLMQTIEKMKTFIFKCDSNEQTVKL